MREQLKKVVYLTDVPFTERDYIRLGVKLYQKAGLEVEVFDLQTVFHPECSVCPGPEGVAEIQSFGELTPALTALGGLGPDTMLINLLPRNAATLPVARKLRACKALCVEVRTNAVPCAGAGSFKRRLARLTGRKIWDALARKLLWPWCAKRPDIIIYGGEAMRPASYEASRVVSAHALDYDLFLGKDESGTEERYIVFVDQCLPSHPDFSVLKSTFPVTPERYYNSLRKFFDLVEAQVGMPVVIAAHPRADYDQNIQWFGSRRVVRNRTVELVRHASLVLLHYSTALNFAVLGNVPMVFLTTNELELSVGPTIAAMAALTKRPVLNIDRLPARWETGLLDVNATAYAAYCRRYIKEPRTSDKLFWQILLDAVTVDSGSPTKP